MGLFSKKPKEPTKSVCDMCGGSDGSICNHVEEIRGENPSWLPANLRAQAQGEYTFLCVRCNSYPAMKWPNEYGASAGMKVHLGSAHRVGMMTGLPRQFDMIPLAR